MKLIFFKRLTSIADLGFYDLIRRFYDPEFVDESYLNKTLQNTTIEDAYNVFINSRKNLDFVFRCYWSGQECSKNFELTFTDYGLCFSYFGNKTVFISESGRSNSLSLVLNLEQYQHMPGPDNDAGIKIYLHDNHKKPLVSDLGIVISPGMHSFIAIKRTETINLPSPIGSCKHSRFKSHAECMDHCRIKSIIINCGCSPILEWENNIEFQKYRRCTLQENFLCFEEKLKKRKYEKLNCGCSVPCRQVIYEPSISSSAISKFSANKLLQRNESILHLLGKRLEKSLEYGETLDETKKRSNKKIIEPFLMNMKVYLKKEFELLNVLTKTTKNQNKFYQPIFKKIITFLTNGIKKFENESILLKNIFENMQKTNFFKSTEKVMNEANEMKNRYLRISESFLYLRCFRELHTVDLDKILGCVNISLNDFINEFPLNFLKNIQLNTDEIWQTYNKIKNSFYHQFDILKENFDYPNNKVHKKIINKCMEYWYDYNWDKIINDSLMLVQSKLLREQSQGVLNILTFCNIMKSYYNGERECHIDSFNSGHRLNTLNTYLLPNLYTLINEFKEKSLNFHDLWKTMLNNHIIMKDFYENTNRFNKKISIHEPITKKLLFELMKNNTVFDKLYENRNILNLVENYRTDFSNLLIEVAKKINKQIDIYLRYFFEPIDNNSQFSLFIQKNNQFTSQNLLECNPKNDSINNFISCVNRVGEIMASLLFNQTISINDRTPPVLTTFTKLQEELNKYSEKLLINEEFFL